MMKFKHYLKLTSQLTNDKINKVIIGNQSADYDSIIGSLVLGYIKLILFKEMFVPIIDCKKEQLKLRFQVDKLFQKHEIDSSLLKFKGQVDLQGKQVILYDHNVRANVKPIEIIDHHFMKDTQCKRTIVGHCGSATTLLYFMLHPNKLPQSTHWVQKYLKYGLPSQQQQYDRQIYELIRVGIMLDSYNLSQNQKNRWDLIDKIALQEIQKDSKKELISFDYLQFLKFDQNLNSKLSLNQHLIKDFKQFTYGDNTVAFSIVLMKTQTFLAHYNRQNIKITLFEMMEKQNYSSYFIMFLFSDQKIYRRQLILYSRNHYMWKFLNNILSGNLGMNAVWSEYDEIYYRDSTNKISRKVLESHISLAHKLYENQQSEL